MLISRPRRLRKSPAIRDLCQETIVTANDLIYPVFIKESAKEAELINAMPGIVRHSELSIMKELEILINKGLKAIAIFPIINEAKKSAQAQEAYNENGFYQKQIAAIKKNFPNLLIISDIALDPYTDHGHDGILINGEIDNDRTVEVLQQMALVQAAAGADIVAPSDMMDGRVQAIRESLEENSFHNTLIMSYTAKYASCLYNPFREALGSMSDNKSLAENIPQDKKTYQMNYANRQEALKELEHDIVEGADIVMVKPASWYLDIIRDFKEASSLPVAAYQVSGEYVMLMAAASQGFINLDKAMIESLTAIKRAGADMILSYFTKSFLESEKN